ncbi:MAG: radical SAM protein [Clostridia bacterium]|nr:radical SAM protein [Clostridia bacterium]
MSIKYYDNIVSPFIQTKALCHIDKLKELQKNKVITPVTCEIDITDGFCNNSCKHCFFETNEKRMPIIQDKNKLFSLFDELKELGVKGIEFTGGGEPLTHPDVKEILEYACECGFNVGLVTNGLLLNTIEDVFGRLSFVRVSLDAGTSKTYSEVHGVDCFEKVINNIKRIVTKHSGEKLGLGYLILPYNTEDIVVAAELARQLGVRFIQYRPASLAYNVDNSIWEYAQEQVKKARFYKDDKFQVFDAGIKWSLVLEKRHYSCCSTSSIVCVIKANGDVPLCVLKRNDKESIIGNIYDEGGVKRVWFSDRHEDLINGVDIFKCRKPCKHDAYNIMFESIKDDYLHCNFI